MPYGSLSVMADSAQIRGATAEPKTNGRVVSGRTHHYPQLDALRGIAAFVVVLSHFVRLWDPATLSPRAMLWLQVFSPLFNGTASVVLFFLLSGFVLSLPYKRRAELPYGIFVLRRLARIYLPYLAALLLALAADWRLNRAVNVSPWFALTWSEPVRWPLVLRHVLLVGNYDTAQINTAFWSLAVEMRLSILFPLLCLPLLRWSKWAATGLAAMFFLGQIAVVHFLTHRLSAVSFTNLTEFGAGVLAFTAGILLARRLEAVQTWWGRLGVVTRVVFLLFSLALLEWGGELRHTHLWPLNEAVVVCGGCGVLLATLCSRRIRTVLNHRLPAWLGRVSYSLYLVHATVLFGLVHVLFGTLTRGELLLPYLGVSLTLAAVFFWLVEKPSIRLSRSIGGSRRLPTGVAGG